MAEIGISQGLLILGSVIIAASRWLVLIAATVLVLFITWIVLNVIWARTDKQAILIRPFVVVDPSGNLKNAENGFAQILSAQMAELQARILQARAVLTEAASGQILTVRLPEDPGRSPRISDAAWPTVRASAEEKLELKVQGVDVLGLVSWIKDKIVPEQKGLRFTVHISDDGEITIAGDVSDLKIDGTSMLYLRPSSRSPIGALDDLALQLFQLRLVGDDRRLRDLPLDEFRTLVDRLCEAVDPRMETQPDTERKQRYNKLATYFVDVLRKYDDWVAMMVLSAETSRRSGDDEAATKYFRLVLDHENRLRSNEQDASLLKLINASLDAVTAPTAAFVRASQVPERKMQAIVRQTVETSDGPAIDRLREGFQALYDAKGEGSYAAIAGLHGAPGWYSWNNLSNSRSSVHRNLFLPWHRAFLMNFEQAGREKVKDFALLCWDWTKGEIPRSFTEQTLPNGKKNPLAGAYIDLPQSKPPITRLTTRDPGAPGDLPLHQDVMNVLNRPVWDEFSKLLENLSNRVHGWTSGDMGILATAAYDPLFYAHQCYVDRLWATWQLAGPDRIDRDLLDVVLEPFGIKVRDVLDITKLGYAYQ